MNSSDTSSGPRYTRAEIEAKIASRPFWYHRIELAEGLVTPGISDSLTAVRERLGWPDRLDGLRVLDIGAAEGCFSFEAERRGAELDSQIAERGTRLAAVEGEVKALEDKVADLSNKRDGIASTDTGLNDVTEALKAVESHEAEVVSLLVESNWELPAASASMPPTTNRELILNGVEIKAYPDLLLVNASSRGALKFYFGKTEKLSPDVGQQMANLLYYFQREVLDDASADANLCIVHDVRQDAEYRATKNYKRMLKNIESACEFIKALWPTL